MDAVVLRDYWGKYHWLVNFKTQGYINFEEKLHLSVLWIEYYIQYTDSNEKLTLNVPHLCSHTGINFVAPVPSYDLDKINGTGD